jgi:1-deoxy-D-xylulose-5-phosphate reductoisomerase
MGSTGSVGRNALLVAASWPDRFRVEALAGGRNLALLAEQAARWRPSWLAVQDAGGKYGVAALKRLLPARYRPAIVAGPEGFARMARLENVDMVVAAQAGAAGLRAVAAAAGGGKTVCLANKESRVLAGPLLRELCARSGAVLLPVDSEHSALFQCLIGRQPDEVARLILTASGGPFLGKSREFLAGVRPEDALQHPRWRMGAKITVDSATLMNKGLEVIEACHLYGMPPEKVDVVIHPQSLVHSLVALRDGSLMAQLAAPDMRLPIAASLAWPEMLDGTITGTDPPDLAKEGTLSFEAPDEESFPCLGLARSAMAADRAVELNAANEVAVARFLAGNIRFTDIPDLVRRILDECGPAQPALSASGQNPEQVLAALEERDASARVRAAAWRAG